MEAVCIIDEPEKRKPITELYPLVWTDEFKKTNSNRSIGSNLVEGELSVVPRLLEMVVTIDTTMNGLTTTITLTFTASAASFNISDGAAWAEKVSLAVKKATATAFECIHARKSFMNFTGIYSDARTAACRIAQGKEGEPEEPVTVTVDTKQLQAYRGMLNNPWGRCDTREEGPRTALVVDDGAMCRKACGAMLTGMGFSVESANDGREAVDKIFRENPTSGEIVVHYYDIIMMDNFMPVMDGSDAVTLLRLNGYMGTVIGLTYDIFDESSKLFRGAGCTTLLLKPLRLQLVKNALSKLGIAYEDK